MAKADKDEVKKEFQILPLRIRRADVTKIDAAYKRLGFKSRSQFLLAAVDSLLRAKGDKAADKLSWAKAGNGAPAEPAAEAETETGPATDAAPPA